MAPQERKEINHQVRRHWQRTVATSLVKVGSRCRMGAITRHVKIQIIVAHRLAYTKLNATNSVNQHYA